MGDGRHNREGEGIWGPSCRATHHRDEEGGRRMSLKTWLWRSCAIGLVSSLPWMGVNLFVDRLLPPLSLAIAWVVVIGYAGWYFVAGERKRKLAAALMGPLLGLGVWVVSFGAFLVLAIAYLIAHKG